MFTGSIVALVTPMKTDGSLDKPRLGELLEWHIAQGTHAISIIGTTGESATLEAAEQKEILRFSLDCVRNRLPLLVGTGSNSTQRTVASTRQAFEEGVDGCLLITPYLNRPTQEGLYQHFKAVAEAAIGPLVLYNVPTRTASDLLPTTVQRLTSFSNIVAIKEALGQTDRYQELIQTCGDKIDILTGDDATTLDLLRLGGKGVISVTANVAPAKVAQMCQAAFAGDWATAEKLEQQLRALNKALFLESNPIPVKWALHQMNKIESSIRLPLTPLSEIYHAPVKEALKQAEVL